MERKRKLKGGIGRSGTYYPHYQTVKLKEGYARLGTGNSSRDHLYQICGINDLPQDDSPYKMIYDNAEG